MSKVIHSIIVLAMLVSTSVSAQQRPLSDIANDLERLAAEVRKFAPTPTPTDAIVLKATDSLEAALAAAPVGATIELAQAATYTCNCVVRKAVTLRTQGVDFGDRRVTVTDTPLMATVTSGNNGPTLDILPGTSDVTIAKIHVLMNAANDGILVGHADSTQTTREQQPRNIIIDQIVLEGAPVGGAKRGIAVNGIDITVTRSTVRDIKKSAQDTQAIGGWNGEGPITIRDNDLEASGETIMFGGSLPTIPGLIPGDILIEGNRIGKNLAWRQQSWTIKNLFECKACRNVTLRNNLLENIWAGQGQSGYAIMLTPEGEPTVIVEKITIENNVIRNAGGGIDVIGTAQIGSSARTNTIVVRNNWFQIDRTTYGGNGWPLFVNRGPKDITVEYNTFETNGNQIVYHDGPPVEGFTFMRNLVTKSGAYGFTGRAADGSNQHWARRVAEYFPMGKIAENVFGSWPLESKNLPGNLFLATSAVTLADGVGTGVVADYGRRR